MTIWYIGKQNKGKSSYNDLNLSQIFTHIFMKSIREEKYYAIIYLLWETYLRYSVRIGVQVKTSISTQECDGIHASFITE